MRKVDADFEEEFEKKKNSPIRRFISIIILLITLIIIYGFYVGPTGLLINSHTINTNKITDSYNYFKIIQFSDVHYGKTIKDKEFKKIVKKINMYNPDIVVFTGDLIDQTIIPNEKQITKLNEYLKEIDSEYGKYYVSGDHDIKFDGYDDLMVKSNFVSLNDKYDIIYNKNDENIFISGINYKSTGDYLKELKFEELPSYKINIMHTPDTFDNISSYNYDLVLAGHTLNGLINIPFYGGLYKEEGGLKYNKPYYQINNTEFYISNGLGTSDLNFRLFNRPSISIYILQKK